MNLTILILLALGALLAQVKCMFLPPPGMLFNPWHHDRYRHTTHYNRHPVNRVEFAPWSMKGPKSSSDARSEVSSSSSSLSQGSAGRLGSLRRRLSSRFGKQRASRSSLESSTDHASDASLKKSKVVIIFRQRVKMIAFISDGCDVIPVVQHHLLPRSRTNKRLR